MTGTASARRRALLSVSDKTHLAELARSLVAGNWEILASGGTGRFLEQAGIPFTPVESVTGNPESFDGRMKTISFELESAILFDRRNPEHVRQAEELGIVPIDLVACNFYPFLQTILRENCTLDQGVEQIDVGGPTMVRAAAKNFASVTVLIDPADYGLVLEELGAPENRGFTTLPTRHRLAGKAFASLVAYDAEVTRWLTGSSGGAAEHDFLALQDRHPLRYGENPHQAGDWYRRREASDLDPLALQHFRVHQGKELSYNNILDIDAVVATLSLLGGERPAAVVTKHGNPCGAAVGQDGLEAFQRAWEGDSLAAFGGIVAVNRALEAAAVRAILEDRFFEVLLAPEFDEEALSLLASRKNLRVLTNPALANPVVPHAREYRSVRGGMLVQDPDYVVLDPQHLEPVTEARPTPEQLQDLMLAWQVCRVSRSNAITLVREGMLVGSGVGQQDRVRACRLAVEKAGERSQGAVAASDAFFPFPDGPEALARAGVKAIIQPGGSVRDRETIDLCNRMGVAMVTTRSIRCFRH